MRRRDEWEIGNESAYRHLRSVEIKSVYVCVRKRERKATYRMVQHETNVPLIDSQPERYQGRNNNE